jgi:hypothetical protein
MHKSLYHTLLICIAVAFSLFFFTTIGPAFTADPNVVAAILGGFVNPYASGYSTDVILCWLVLLFWIIYEARAYRVKYGWVCLVLGMVPGVVVGFALYLIIRDRQLTTSGT